MDYEKLRLDILQKLVDERGIVCKNKKDDMIKHLIMDDEGKYVRETTYERNSGGFIVGIDIKNKNHQQQMSKLIEKKEAKYLNRYEDNRIIYWSNQKLM